MEIKFFKTPKIILVKNQILFIINPVEMYEIYKLSKVYKFKIVEKYISANISINLFKNVNGLTDY